MRAGGQRLNQENNIMPIHHILKKDICAEVWQGGLTYQSFIFPETCQYQHKDFLFRISSATIELDQSIFTTFTGYSRYLCMLDNHIDISINHQRYALKPLDLIFFKSDDQVISYGRGTDFNLMLRQDIAEHTVQVWQGATHLTTQFSVIYAYQQTTLSLNQCAYTLHCGDVMVIEQQSNQQTDHLISSTSIILSQFSL